MTRRKEPPIGSTELPDYKSPPSRIVRSLREGYDNLRSKVAEKSEQIQDIRGKLRDTQESRDDWKTRAKDAESKIIKLQEENDKLQERLKKKDIEVSDNGKRCKNYKYTIRQVLISIECYINSSAGFRALSDVFQILSKWISSLATPSYTTIRQWLLKIGLYNLKCAKQLSSRYFLKIDTILRGDDFFRFSLTKIKVLF